MALSRKARVAWSLVVLVIGMPIWIVLSITVVNMLPRQSILLELLIFVLLGIVWILPFKKLFQGVSAKDPDDVDSA